MSASRNPHDQKQFIIPPKLFKKSSNLINSLHCNCNVINYNIEVKSFPDSTKIASPRPLYMKKSRHKIENNRPISIFNVTKGHSQVVWP